MRKYMPGLFAVLLGGAAVAQDGAVELTAQNTVIALPAGGAAGHVQKAADTLQRYLRFALGVDGGVPVVGEGEAVDPDRIVLAIGRTRWADASELDGMWRDAYLIRRRGNVVVIAGGTDRGTYYGAIGFLDKIAGVRFYMPGDLFTSRPAGGTVALPTGLQIVFEPYTKVMSMSGIGGAPGAGDWSARNHAWTREGMAGTHQHNMWNAFHPDRYAEKYPRIYPVIDGQRYVPTDPKDQRWQPCLSAEDLTKAAMETLGAYYAEHPDHIWYSFGVQDAHVVCECERCTAVYERFEEKFPGDKHYKARAWSDMFWAWMNDLGKQVKQQLPGKRIEALGYAMSRFPPDYELEDNIVVFTNLHVSELEGDRILQPREDGPSRLDTWLRIISAFGNHDWYRGTGYIMPRLYSGYWSRYMRHLKQSVPVTYQHAEMYPNWGMDGPKGWILAKILWDPGVDPDTLLDQFCDDMFGPASQLLHKHFTNQERLWILMDNVDGPERKIKKWSNQFVTTPTHRRIIADSRRLLDLAVQVARTPEQKQRIELFSRTFRLSEYMYELAGPGDTASQAKIDEAKKYARERILDDPMTLHDSTRDAETIDAAIRGAIGSKKIVP